MNMLHFYMNILYYLFLILHTTQAQVKGKKVK